MANSKLTNTYYKVPNNVISEIIKAYKNCDDKYPGKKKAEFIIREKRLSYENLRRYKNFFDSYNKTTYGIEDNNDQLDEINPQMDYLLRGGNLMRDFVNDKLNEITKKIDHEKEVKSKYAGLDNQYKKETEFNNLRVNTDNNFIRSESIIKENIDINDEIDELKRVSKELKRIEKIDIPSKQLVDIFKNSPEVTLSNSIWKILENTESNEVKVNDWKFVNDIAKKYRKTDPETLKKSIENNSYNRPLIIKLGERYILVAGNTRLSTAAAMGVKPKVIIGDISNKITESIIKESTEEKIKMLLVSLSIIFNKENKILLVKRSNTTDWCPGCWGLVGGKIEKGETPDEGLLREVFEETQITLKKYQIKKILKINNILEYLYLSKVDNDFIVLNSEHSEFKWCDVNEIKNIDNTVPELINYIKYVIL